MQKTSFCLKALLMPSPQRRTSALKILLKEADRPDKPPAHQAGG